MAEKKPDPDAAEPEPDAAEQSFDELIEPDLWEGFDSNYKVIFYSDVWYNYLIYPLTTLSTNRILDTVISRKKT